MAVLLRQSFFYVIISIKCIFNSLSVIILYIANPKRLNLLIMKLRLYQKFLFLFIVFFMVKNTVYAINPSEDKEVKTVNFLTYSKFLHILSMSENTCSRNLSLSN